jgi:DNA-binding MarR family transcriptional regulator
MSVFKVETNTTTTDITVKRKSELIKQIESLQRFYYDIGYDTSNIRTIFSLTLSYLKGHVNRLVIKSFFEVLMNQNKLNLGKEVNLLNCFDDLIEELDYDNESVTTITRIDSDQKEPSFIQTVLGIKEAA